MRACARIAKAFHSPDNLLPINNHPASLCFGFSRKAVPDGLPFAIDMPTQEGFARWNAAFVHLLTRCAKALAGSGQAASR
jgi:hypothetical protein